MNKITILLLSFVSSIPLFFVMLALALSGYIVGAKIVMSIGCIGYPLIAIWVLKNSDELFKNIVER